MAFMGSTAERAMNTPGLRQLTCAQKAGRTLAVYGRPLLLYEQTRRVRKHALEQLHCQRLRRGRETAACQQRSTKGGAYSRRERTRLQQRLVLLDGQADVDVLRQVARAAQAHFAIRFEHSQPH
eukprot:609397-Pleurochrysis_carterae.AAC.2